MLVAVSSAFDLFSKTQWLTARRATAALRTPLLPQLRYPPFSNLCVADEPLIVGVRRRERPRKGQALLIASNSLAAVARGISNIAKPLEADREIALRLGAVGVGRRQSRGGGEARLEAGARLFKAANSGIKTSLLSDKAAKFNREIEDM